MDIKLGDLIKSNVKSKEGFELLMDKKGITDINSRQKYLENYDKMLESIKKIGKSFSNNFKIIAESLSKIAVDWKPLVNISNYFSEIFKPLFKIFTDFSKKLKKFIPPEWVDKLLTELKMVKGIYIKKLIKAYNVFINQLFIYKNDKDKQLIIFSQFVLYLSAIFENYTKKLIEIFKDQPEELKEKLYRDEIKSIIKKFYDPLEINYARLFGYLYNIADNIKHKDLKFYKRFSKYTYEELIIESNELYLDLKLYLKKSLVSFFLIQVRLYHLSYE